MSTRLVIAVVGACGLLLVAGCQFDTSGIPASGRAVTIPIAVMRCPTVAQPLSVSLDSPSGQFPQVTNYQQVPNLLGNPATVYPVYVEGDVVIANIGYDRLKGALLIQTSMADAGIDAPQFLRVILKNDSRAFYVAYDSRAKTKPAWLAQDYTQERDPATHAPYYITTTLADTSPARTGPVRLEVWRRTQAPKAGDVVVIPGNDYSAPGVRPDWGSVPLNNRAMFVVLIGPEERLDCAQGEKVEPYMWWECVPGEQAVDQKSYLDAGRATAVAECQRQHPALHCVPTVLYDEQGRPYTEHVGPWQPSCSITIQGSTLKQTTPRGFNVDSEIEFDPAKSLVRVTVRGKQYSTPASGKLYFDYLFQTHEIRLNDMHIHLDPLSTDVGAFKEVTSTLATLSTAHCQDSGVAQDQPCTHYRIPTGEFLTGETFDLEGATSFIGTANDQPIDITINHATRTFQISGGPLSTTLDLDGQAVPVTLSLDLTGHFVNFAPIAVGRESTRYVECSENTNDRPVLLSAAGSFDVYDQLPVNPTTYQWYEDYGLVTEKVRGQGKTVTIAPHQLAFGTHSFTLVVHDKNGVAATDSVLLTVGDSKPPSLSVPPDVLVLQPASTIGPQKVDLGQAGGSDACSMKAVITNDAPAGLVFPPGVTSVTWTADDRRGNLVTKVQKVSLLETLPFGKAHYKQRVALLAGIAGQVEASVRACRGLEQCPLDLSTLRDAFQQLAEAVEAEPGLADRQRLVATLGRARRQVLDIEVHLAESNMNPRSRARLREAAIGSASRLTALLQREAR